MAFDIRGISLPSVTYLRPLLSVILGPKNMAYGFSRSVNTYSVSFSFSHQLHKPQHLGGYSLSKPSQGSPPTSTNALGNLVFGTKYMMDESSYSGPISACIAECATLTNCHIRSTVADTYSTLWYLV
jgi:hypothetical protein